VSMRVGAARVMLAAGLAGPLLLAMAHATPAAASDPDAAVAPAVWAVKGTPAHTWILAEREIPTASSRQPDGMRNLWLTLRLGQDDPRPVFTNAISVTDLLRALDIKLGPKDRVRPNGQLLYPGMRLRVTRPGQAPVIGPSRHGSQAGQASWYQCPTDGLFAAHLTIPKGTRVTVTSVATGDSITVVINDRGPYGVAGRIIDLCSGAFAQLAPLSQGVADVTITW